MTLSLYYCSPVSFGFISMAIFMFGKLIYSIGKHLRRMEFLEDRKICRIIFEIKKERTKMRFINIDSFATITSYIFRRFNYWLDFFPFNNSYMWISFIKLSFWVKKLTYFCSKKILFRPEKYFRCQKSHTSYSLVLNTTSSLCFD